MSQNRSKVYLKKSEIHERGVFAKKRIKSGQIIEKCKAQLFPKEGAGKKLENIRFSYDQNNFAIAEGYGAIYNHSDKPNAAKFMHEENGINYIIFIALGDIEKDVEITHEYRYVNFEVKK